MIMTVVESRRFRSLSSTLKARQIVLMAQYSTQEPIRLHILAAIMLVQRLCFVQDVTASSVDGHGFTITQRTVLNHPLQSESDLSRYIPYSPEL